MAPESADPRDVSTIVVRADDVVTAYETTRTTDRRAVLRVTPPFAPRMRARLHVEGDDEYDDAPRPIHDAPRPIHVAPAQLLRDTPPYPSPDETEDQLRGDEQVDYTVERHHERHKRAIEAWRDQIATAIVDATTIETEWGPVEVDVAVLGDA